MKASVAYSYDLVREAARAEQAEPRWRDDPLVNKLEFSDHWVTRCLKRATMRRRKITTDKKEIPTPSIVIATMLLGQNMYAEGEFDPSTTWNMDETAIMWGIDPLYVYIPPDQARGSTAGSSKAKERITGAICVNANGVFAPLFMIMRQSGTKPDQRSMQVLKKLHKMDDGFGLSNNWHFKTWNRKLNIQDKKGNWHENDYWCHYLVHGTTGNVIVSQVKAWNDTIRMCMWLDLVMKPIRDRAGKLLLWMDNCGCHKVKCVEDLMKELDILLALFPPNMTGTLQPLDLYVNMPIKSNTRKLRARRIVDDFGEFKEQVALENLKPINDRVDISFKARKPLLTLGMHDLVNLFNNEFKDEKFQKGIKNCFIKVGITPMNDVGVPIFRKYKADDNSGSSINPPPCSLVLNKQSDEVRRAIELVLDEDSDDDEDDFVDVIDPDDCPYEFENFFGDDYF